MWALNRNLIIFRLPALFPTDLGRLPSCGYYPEFHLNLAGEQDLRQLINENNELTITFPRHSDQTNPFTCFDQTSTVALITLCILDIFLYQCNQSVPVQTDYIPCCIYMGDKMSTGFRYITV